MSSPLPNRENSMKNMYNVTKHMLEQSTRNMENHTTCPDRSSPVSSATMFSIGVLGNICAILVICKSSRKHKWKAFYRYVLLLAITDLLGILLTSPITLYTYANNKVWIGGQIMCDFYGFQMAFSGVSTVLLAAAMSVDRLIAVYFPYFYTKEIKDNPRRINYVLVLVWIFAASIGVSPVFGFGQNEIQFPYTWCFFKLHSEKTLDKIYCILYASTILIVILIMAICNALVIAFLKNETGERLSDFRRKVSITSVKTSRKKQDKYIIVFLVAIFVVFSACWTPFMIFIFVTQSGIEWNGNTELMIIRIASLNQIIDPWVYILLRKENLIKFQRFCIRTKDRTCQCQCNSMHLIKAPCVHISVDTHS